MEQNIGLYYSDGLKKKKKRGDVTIYMHFQ